MRAGNRKFCSLLLVFLLVWLWFSLLMPLFFPFFLGLGLALAAEPMVRFLNKQLHIPRSVSTGIAVSMTFCLLAAAAFVLCAFALREMHSLSSMLPDLENAARSGIALARDWLLGLSDRLPLSIRPLVQDNVLALFSDGSTFVGKTLGYLLSVAGNLLGGIPNSALSLGTAVLSGYMLSAKLPKIRQKLLQRIPREKQAQLRTLLSRLRKTLGGWLKAQCKLMGVTFVIVVLGLTLLRVTYAPIWALGICLVDALPVLGTGTILLPWSLLRLLQGDGARALGLLGIYVTVTLVRSVLEPKLLGRHLGLDPLMTLVAMYAGFRLWGVGGLILSPLLAVTALQLVSDKP